MTDSQFDYIKIQLASPDQIRQWAYRVLPNGEVVGEVIHPETLNYRTHQPETGGLFCEKIFGPIRDWECKCGKYKLSRQKKKSIPIICESCGVEVTQSKIRRYRIGCIELAAPIAHIWYFKNRPSYIPSLLGLKLEDIENLIYFIDRVSPSYFESDLILRKKKESTKTGLVNRSYIFYELESSFEDKEKDQIGAEAVLNLLKLLDLKKIFSTFSNQFLKIRPLYLKFYKDYEKVRYQFQILNSNLKNKEIRRKKNKYYRSILQREKGDLWKQKREIRETLRNLLKSKTRLLKRLRIIKNFLKTESNPEWMILSVLPVLPPDLRPMVQFNAGQLATSDLNDLYKKVLNRNNRLKKFQKFYAPEIIVRNETRLLQESVDNLIDNNSQNKVVGSSNRPLKSLSEVLEGKQGRFRQNLLGKRVDYSGRSVIVVDPQLKFHQCGLPKEMAIELFQPFLLQQLIQSGLANTIKGAKKKVQKRERVVFQILKTLLKNHPVLLNRAPTLHRLSIQAFEPILINSRAIKLHPLVCPPFNADFDGDQMAVHVPLSKEAQLEARILMLSTNNLLSPASGQPISLPSQDMILGCYYLTSMNFQVKPYISSYFGDPKYVLNQFFRQKLPVQTVIWVRVLKEFHSVNKKQSPLEVQIQKFGRNSYFYIDHLKFQPTGTRFVRTTVGRILFNQIVQDCLVSK